MAKLYEAINLYNKNAQYVIEGDDYDNLDWHSKDIQKPTLEQLQILCDEVDRIKAEAELEQIAKRQALLNKLGITEEEAKLLLG
jgi:ribosomal 50S subunit-associated protein YjgA (DUF615 family)